MGRKKKEPSVVGTFIDEEHPENNFQVVANGATHIDIVAEEPREETSNMDNNQVKGQEVETVEECNCESLCDDPCSCNEDCCEHEEPGYSYRAPCKVGDIVYRVSADTDNQGNISYKVQPGRVFSVRFDGEYYPWIEVCFGVGLSTVTLRACEYDYSLQEVTDRLAILGA